MAELHPDLNDGLDPHRITLGSDHRATWLCTRCPCGHPHVWEANVQSRAQRGRGCPVCTDCQPCRCNSLAVKHPDIAAQWHPTLNAGRQPQDLLPGSGARVWWTCARHGGWQAVVKERTCAGGSGCPQCAMGARAVKGKHAKLQARGVA